MIPPSVFCILQPEDPSCTAAPVCWSKPPLIALYKNSGVLVHNSAYAGPPEETLLDQAQAQTGDKPFPLHRIDRGTSGLVLALDTKEQIGAWMDALHRPEAVREYIAIVRGHLEERVRVERPIPNGRGEDKPAKSIIVPMRKSKIARLTLVRVRTFTGRQHQVRRHCRSIGHPVVGDATWGNSRFNREIREAHGLDRLALHAWRVQFEGPNGWEYDLVTLPDSHLHGLSRTLFGFEDWRMIAGMETLDGDADRVHRDKGGSGEAVG